MEKSKHLYTLLVEIYLDVHMSENRMALYNKFEIAVCDSAILLLALYSRAVVLRVGPRTCSMHIT